MLSVTSSSSSPQVIFFFPKNVQNLGDLLSDTFGFVKPGLPDGWKTLTVIVNKNKKIFMILDSEKKIQSNSLAEGKLLKVFSEVMEKNKDEKPSFLKMEFQNLTPSSSLSYNIKLGKFSN